jgi:hypothetical protein
MLLINRKMLLHITVIIPLIMICNNNARSQVVNVKVKQRGEFTGHYKVYGGDYALYDGKINDNDALQILNLVVRDYNNGVIYKDVINVWENIDDVYSGGKYHGRIILQICRLYFNEAFKEFHYGSLHGPFNDSSDNFQRRGCDADKYSIGFGELGSTGKRKYGYKQEYNYRIIPEFNVRFKNEYNSNYRYIDWFKNSQNAEYYCYKTLPSKNKLIVRSAEKSSKNIEEVLLHIFNTVRADDDIYTNGEYDDVLIKVLGLYNTTKSLFGVTVAKNIYSKVGSVIYMYINKENNKELFKNKCNSLGVEIKLNTKSKFF